MGFNCKVLLIILIIIVVIAIIYLLVNNNGPIPNSGSITDPQTTKTAKITKNTNTNNKELLSDTSISSIGSYDNSDQKYASYQNSPKMNDSDDSRDFVYKKKKFTIKTPQDIKDQFDVSKMLPAETENDWFDVEPLNTTKKINGTHLIHPKVHIGENTILSSLRNATHDIRGDIPNPKVAVSVWNNSTIDPDTNIKGLCN